MRKSEGHTDTDKINNIMVAESEISTPLKPTTRHDTETVPPTFHSHNPSHRDPYSGYSPIYFLVFQIITF